MDKTDGKPVDRKGEPSNEKLVSDSRSGPGANQSINQYWINLTHNLAMQGLIGKGVLPDTHVDTSTSKKGEPPNKTQPTETAPKAEQPKVVEPKPGEVQAPKPGDVKAKPGEVPAKAGDVPAKTSGVPAKTETTPGKPDAVKAPTVAVPGRTDAVPGRAETVPGKSDTVQPKHPESAEQKPGVTRALYHLDHRTSDAKTPDAMVVIPPNFDKNKPINLVIYNHGWYDTASSSVKHAQLEQQMKNAPPNTVLVVPEWQTKPGSSGQGASNEGRFGNENFVSGMVQDVFNNTPELKGKTLADVNHVGIISHSAGYVPTESELYKNPELAGKINSVTMLDSLYDGHGLDKWIHQNIGALSNGTKHYQNIFNTTTTRNSEIQSQFVANELKKYNGSKAAEFVDHSGTLLTPAQIKRHPIVFKSTSMPHMEIPKNYVAITEEAADR